MAIENMIKLEKSPLDNEVIRLHSTKGIYGKRFLIQIEMIMLSRVYKKLIELDLLEKSSIVQTLKTSGKTYMIFKNGRWKLSISTKKTINFLNILGIPIA